MCKAMSGIVSNHRAPAAIEATLELHNKAENPASFQFESDARSILVVKETAKLNRSHLLSPGQPQLSFEREVALL